MSMSRILTAFFGLQLFLSSISPCACFTPTETIAIRTILFEKQRGVDASGQESSTTSNPVELVSWYAVEAFGKVFGNKKSSISAEKSNVSIDFTKPPSSLEETVKRIQLDNDRSYFLSGEVDGLIYDETCTFADPFVSFSGRDRFIENLSNLGSFITNYDAKTIKFEMEDDGRKIITKVMVKLELNLPWKPVLAWPWGVSYTLDPESFLVTKHIESWDIEPWKGVAQIFRRPTVKVGKNST